MEWYWIALIAGIIAPWVVMGSSIRLAFEERGLLVGLGWWLGVCGFTIPVIFLIMWLARVLFG